MQFQWSYNRLTDAVEFVMSQKRKWADGGVPLALGTT
jgi:hypothetical protein